MIATDLTAADWAAMRKLVDAANAEVLNQSASYWRQLRANMDEAQFALLTASLQQWPLALDALARLREAQAWLTAENARLKEDGADHKGAEIAEVHAEILHRAEQSEAAVADRDATIARLRDELVKEELLHDEQLRRALTAKEADRG